MSELANQIREAYFQDQKSGKVAISRDDIPLSYESISNAWLTAILCNNSEGAMVTNHHLDVPDDGSNNRRRIFIEYNEQGNKAGLPSSVFCKATHGLANRLMLGHSGAILCEFTFYQYARDLLDIEAPKAIFAAFDKLSFNSILVLNDMSSSAEFCCEKTVVDRSMIEKQLDLLAKLHSRFYQSPQLDTTLVALPSYQQRFNNSARFHLKDSCLKGFEAAREVLPSSLSNRWEDIWSAIVQSIEIHNDLPWTLCHGDMHLRNWYITQDSNVGLSDWGVAHKGHWSRDIAYLLAVSLKTENRRAWEEELIDYYLERMRQYGIPRIPLDKAMLYYRQAMMTAFALWLKTLKPAAGMPNMQPEETALVFLQRLGYAINDLDILALYS